MVAGLATVTGPPRMLFGADSRALFTALLIVIIVERCFELYISVRNGRRALASGGIESGRDHYPWMVAVHTAFLFSCVGEVWLLGPPFIPALATSMLGLMAATMALRYWAIATLGERWNTRVICVPGAPAVHGGPYRWMRHPNYLAVILEVAALPLFHTAWRTALLFSALNAAVLRVRIRVEEKALAACSDYEEAFAGQRGLLPGRGNR